MRIFVGVIAVVIFLANINHGLSQEQGQQNGAAQKQADADEAEKFAVPVRVLPDPVQDQKAKSDAEKAQRDEKRDDENLAIQRSVAESSKEVAQLAAPMFYVSMVGLLLSVVTVLAGGAAAWFALGSLREARSAASTAQDALLAAEETSKRQLRAYLVLDAAEIPAAIPLGMFYVVCRLKNCGQTPATITSVGVVCIATSALLPTDFDTLKENSASVIIGAGGTIEYHAANTSVSFAGMQPMVARGFLQIGFRIKYSYSDIFGREHSAEFTRTIEAARNLQGSLGVSANYPDVTT